MSLFYLFSFVPLVVFSLSLWWDIRGRDEYRKRDNLLLLSIVCIAAACAVLSPFLARLIEIEDAIVIPLFQVVTFLYFLAYFVLEYSIHIRRIENSYYLNDFRRNLKTCIGILIIGGVTAVLGFWITMGAGVLSGVSLVAFKTVDSFLFLFWMLFTLYFFVGVVFNLPEGISRRRIYPFMTLLGVAGFSGLQIWLSLLVFGKGGFLFPVYMILNVVYIARVYMEYLFYRTLHYRKQIQDQEVQRKKRNELAALVISSTRNEDNSILRIVIQSALEEMKNTVVVKEHTFTGAMLWRRSHNTFRVESSDLIIGYCTPLAVMENIKRINHEQLTGLLLRQSLDLDNLDELQLTAGMPGSFGPDAVRKMLDTKKPVKIDNMPSCYRGLHELMYLVPVYNRDRCDGFLVLFKDSFSNILVEEERSLTILAETLALILLIMNGKDVQVERNRLQGELEIARNIQTSIVPAVIEIPGYDCACSMTTAAEVGGDIYDHLAGKGRHILAIGDVSGHGLSAGIMALVQMAAMHGAVAASEAAGKDLEAFEIYDIVNTVLCRINRDRIGSDKFMTQNYFIENNGRFSHAGTHLVAYRYVKKADTVVEMHECTNRTGFLGLSEFISGKSSQAEFSMDSGDILLVYTDGLLEARNSGLEQYGPERLKQAFYGVKDADAAGILSGISEDLSAFAWAGDLARNNGRFADDITMVVLRKL